MIYVMSVQGGEACLIYVMSDIHGCHALFRKMCQKIDFTEEDDLYILGDFIDRGDTPIPLLLDCMERINVYPLLGNHEAIMLQCINGLPAEAERRLDHPESVSRPSAGNARGAAGLSAGVPAL